MRSLVPTELYGQLDVLPCGLSDLGDRALQLQTAQVAPHSQLPNLHNIYDVSRTSEQATVISYGKLFFHIGTLHHHLHNIVEGAFGHALPSCATTKPSEKQTYVQNCNQGRQNHIQDFANLICCGRTQKKHS